MTTNPYQPNEAKNVERYQMVRSRSPASAAMVAFGAFGYCAFTIYLLSHGVGRDQDVGFLFLKNVPVLIVWCFSLIWVVRLGVVLGVVSTLAQFSIAIVMVNQYGATAIVLGVNAIAIFAMAVLTLVCSSTGQRLLMENPDFHDGG